MYRTIRPNNRRGVSAACLLLVVLLCAVSASAQVEVGDKLNLGLSGNLGFGYSGSFGNAEYQSNHGEGVNGNAVLNGYYFHPNFLSFEFRPYYDRAASSADIQSVSSGQGFGGFVNVFGGSHFPGSIGFGVDRNSEGQSGMPGLPSAFGASSGKSLSFTWNALVPKWPQLWTNLNINSSSSSILGAAGDSHSAARNLNLSSNYAIKGFDLRANLTHFTSSFDSPAYLTGTAMNSSGSGTNYGASLQHKLPMSGGFSLAWARSNYNGDASNWNSSSYSAGAGITPWRRVTFNENVSYTTNLAAALGQFELNGNAPLLRLGNDSNSLFMTSSGTYTVGKGLTVSGNFNQQMQHLGNRDYSNTQFGGTASFNKASRLFGFLFLSLGIVDTASKFGNNGAGLMGNASASKRFGPWDTSADFSYSQNVQTMMAIATTSSYSYGGTLRRKIGSDMHWNVSFRGSHSGIVQVAGSGSRSENYGSTLSWKRYSFSGSYANSSGSAVYNSSGGLTATSVGSLFTDEIMLFNARSYNINVSTRLSRKLSVSGAYGNVYSRTAQGTIDTFASGNRYNSRMEYRLRRFAIIGGFNRTQQNLSTLVGPPRVVNSYYLSLSRWFNVF